MTRSRRRSAPSTPRETQAPAGESDIAPATARERDQHHRAAVGEAHVEVPAAEVLDDDERQVARDDVQREGRVGEVVERPRPEACGWRRGVTAAAPCATAAPDGTMPESRAAATARTASATSAASAAASRSPMPGILQPAAAAWPPPPKRLGDARQVDGAVGRAPEAHAVALGVVEREHRLRRALPQASAISLG